MWVNSKTQQNLCAPGPRGKEQRAHKRLSQTCLWVSRSLWEVWADSGLLWGQEHWIQQCWHKSFWRTYYCHYPYHSLASGQTTGKEHSPNCQQKIGLKIYWEWPCPSEEDPDSPTASPSHQEASTSLLSLSIRGKTEWKQQSQKTNQTDHKDYSLV